MKTSSRRYLSSQSTIRTRDCWNFLQETEILQEYCHMTLKGVNIPYQMLSVHVEITGALNRERKGVVEGQWQERIETQISGILESFLKRSLLLLLLPFIQNFC